MERKRTTGLPSVLMSKVDDQKGSLDSEMARLDENDIWFYQVRFEQMIQVYLPDPQMNGRYMAMIRLLCAQARRMAKVDKEEKDG